MAIVSKTICDVCRTDREVYPLMVSYDSAVRRAWEVDLCTRCYQDTLGDLASGSRPTSRSNLRPQARVRKTEISEENL